MHRVINSVKRKADKMWKNPRDNLENKFYIKRKILPRTSFYRVNDVFKKVSSVRAAVGPASPCFFA